MNEQIEKRITFITIAFVIISIFLRGFAESTEYSIPVVALLNALMLAYTFFTVYIELDSFLYKRKSKNFVFKEQYMQFHKMKRIPIIGGIIVAGIYVLFMILMKSESSIGGVINDSVAYITFGISLESDKIYNKLNEYFSKTDFTLVNKI